MMRAISSPSSSTTGRATLDLCHTCHPRMRLTRRVNLGFASRRKYGALQSEATRRRHASESSRIHLPCRARRLREHRHRRGDGWHNLQQSVRLWSRKSLGNYVIEQGAQRRPVAVDIDEQDRLVVKSELLPADCLEHLVECSNA